MPDWLVVVLLGIVEGITEFLPISSTAHLLITEHFLPGAQKFVGNDLFNIVIQCGAVVAVIPLASFLAIIPKSARRRLPDLPALPRQITGPEIAARNQLRHDAHRDLRHRLRADVEAQRGVDPAKGLG